ncbi:unnamed protein product [Schistocephalus solidus]|uniref:START domain-containing protein n=1 Tax=Schistocephalus solidus TaxID=70667 RepID=A0A183S7V8_SCHSO|nr:unnamed protein product [Schistocephalus solidus]
MRKLLVVAADLHEDGVNEMKEPRAEMEMGIEEEYEDKQSAYLCPWNRSGGSAGRATQTTTCSLSLDIMFRSLLLWVIVVADMSCAIPGADFCIAVNLLVDCRQSHFHDHTNMVTVRCIPSSEVSQQLAILDPAPTPPFWKIIDKSSGIAYSNFITSTPPHAVLHHIRTTGLPVFSWARHLAASNAEVDQMHQMGIARQSDSHWVSFHTWFSWPSRKPEGLEEHHHP